MGVFRKVNTLHPQSHPHSGWLEINLSMAFLLHSAVSQITSCWFKTSYIRCGLSPELSITRVWSAMRMSRDKFLRDFFMATADFFFRYIVTSGFDARFNTFYIDVWIVRQHKHRVYFISLFFCFLQQFKIAICG